MDPERIECTRAQFADMWGVWPAPDAIGVCLLSADRTTIVKEYVFTEDLYVPGKFLVRLQREAQDVAELERMLRL